MFVACNTVLADRYVLLFVTFSVVFGWAIVVPVCDYCAPGRPFELLSHGSHLLR